MYYNCEPHIEAYVDSFKRTQESREEKEGLVLPQMEDLTYLEEELVKLFFPGLSGGESRAKLNHVIRYHMENVTRLLIDSINLAYCYEDKGEHDPHIWEQKAIEVVDELAATFPEIRNRLKLDAVAGYRGDPAAKSVHEVILSYPGIHAMAIHRVAHFLYRKDVPLIPRMMTELVHRTTGIDIHPGAEIGDYFFIDHGTGIVIGESAIIGNHVKIYQGVTLGAISFKKDAEGNIMKEGKRHPTIEDGCTIYANATILGDVTIGRNSVIGSSTWIREDIPPCSLVTAQMPKITIRKRLDSPCCCEESADK